LHISKSWFNIEVLLLYSISSDEDTVRAKSKSFKRFLTKLLIAGLVAVPIQFVAFTAPAQAVAAPGSINLANASNGNSSLSTTLTQAPGTGDLTYEFWYKQTDSTGNQVVFSTESSPNAGDGFTLRKNYGTLEAWSGGNYLAGSGIDYMNLDQWNHFVIMRVGTTKWIIYRNGNCRAWFNFSSTTSTKLTLGSSSEASFRGKIANFRYSKSALYSDPKFSNFLKEEPRFAVPLVAQTATPETKVLLNTVQGANFAVDTSSSPNTFTLSAANPPTSSTDTPLPIYAEFLNNGGSGTMANQVSSVSANFSSNTFTKSGSTFIGWNTAADGTGDFYKNGATYAFTSSISLHAQWSSDSVPVDFNTDGGSFVAGSSVVIGSAIQSAPTAPTKAGYSFGGWKATSGGSAVTFPYYPILSTEYVASVSSAALVDLGRYSNNGTWVSSTWYGPNRGTSPASTRDFATYTDGRKYIAVRESNNSVLLNPTRLDGYYMVPLDSSTTLTAIWTATSNAVTYNLGGADGTPPTQANVSTAASFTTAAAPTRVGYTFNGWNNGVSNTAANTSYTMGDSSVTLTAQWTQDVFNVTFDSKNGVTSNVVSTNYGSAATTPSAPTWYGYNFKGWAETSNGPVVDPSTIAISGVKTFHAIWEQKSIAGLTSAQLGTPDVITPHATLDKSVTSTIGNTNTVVKVPAGALPTTFAVKVYTLTDNDIAEQTLGANNSYIISQVIAWSHATDGTIQDTASGKPIEMTITSPDIKTGAKVYSIIGNVSTLLATATQDGSVRVTFSEDPVIVVQAAPVVTQPPGAGGGGGYVAPPTPTPTTVPVATVAKSFNILGFNPGSWKLTKSIKNSIDAFFKSINKPSKISCVGYTMGPTVLRVDNNLAMRRGQEVCKYIGAKNPTIANVITKGTTTKITSDFYRRTKVTVTN
jgi:uncharacterized repeat protein (TIGR02543 family)